jgi:uncharacterized protein involved in exopolysaccharide biosynthesis
MEEANRSFNLWKMLLVIARRKFFITAFVFLATLIAVITALVLPEWYRAKASILPSQYDQPLGITGNFTQFSLSSAGFELPIMATPSDVYATMLKSETVARQVIEENGLLDYFKMKSVQKCYLYLMEKTRVKVTGEGIVEFYFEDKDPEMAALIANSFINSLDALNRQVKSAKAASDRGFIKSRLEKTESLLDSARINLISFQKQYKAVDLDEQKNVAIIAATELKKQLALTEVNLEVRRKMYSDDHPEVNKLKNEVDQIREQLAEIERGTNQQDSYFSVGLDSMPSLTARFAELEADIGIQEKVLALLTGLYEEARIKEQRNTPTISVLEKAYPPEIKYKPKRAIIVAATFSISMVLAIFIALFADYLENLRRTSPADFELVNQVRNEIRGKTGFSDS